ncbi:c-type cytochrome [Jannaschia sp. W003]|uniref:c-type cytochrome n=1 Tax=Jannaschia sp. W003 TaxID=2867012 RepID=UPI0021A8DBB5|nr:c-type cytochrome [Jannaschia sp. W003]UWQ20388.1 c-type cytochrome [Jannaschia sp. W003]
MEIRALLAAAMLSLVAAQAGAGDGTGGTDAAEGGADEAASTETAAAGDPEVGAAIYDEVCKNCHGPTGKGMASFPKLVGHDAAYLIEKLEAYRAGEKVGPNSALMYGVAEELTDDDIAGLAAYIVDELG